MSRFLCLLGVVFVLSIACLHITGINHYTAQIRASNASDFLKSMFLVLYALPSLYLTVLAAFGVLAALNPAFRRSICLILSVSVLATGLLALMLQEWIPLVIMSLGAALFLLSALSSKRP